MEKIKMSMTKQTPVFNVYEPSTLTGDNALVAFNRQFSFELAELIKNSPNASVQQKAFAAALGSLYRQIKEEEELDSYRVDTSRVYNTVITNPVKIEENLKNS